MKKYVVILGLLLSLMLFYPANAADNQVTIHVFGLATCPHCVVEKAYLTELVNQYPQIHLAYYEISANQDNVLLLQKVANELNVEISGVPFTVIGNEYFIGYLNDDTTGETLRQTALKYESGEYDDLVTRLAMANSDQTDKKIVTKDSTEPLLIDLPIWGQVDVKKISLPIFTILIAAVDGFNPCAMWILLFLIS
ncbi:MAG: hypothetical protein WC575_04385, partial [Patescibacteria group bacterium]